MKSKMKWTSVGKMLTMTSCLIATSIAGTLPASANSTPAPVEQKQGQFVKGAVVDKNGEPVIGASVIEKGTSNGTITDIDGNFELKLKQSTSPLIISYVGYETQEITPNGKVQKIVLQEDSELLADVVVIGYGTQKKGDITSSVASIKSEDFSAGKIGDATDLIKGKVAGLAITTSSGDPTASNEIRLRGVTSVCAGNDPLILVDGIEGSLTDIAPENIAAIDILKDASAAAIYGTRGANGVIIVTTKSGRRDQKLEAVYSAYASMSNWTKKSDFMDAADIRAGKTSFTDGGADTDWLKEVSNDHGYAQNHSLSLTGGTSSSTYSANLAYTKEEGVMKCNGNENIRLQMDITHYALKDKVKFNFNALLRQHNYDINNNAYVYRQAIIRNPSSPIYNEDGSYNEDWNRLYYYNPVEMQKEYYGEARSRHSRLTGSVTIEPIKNWKTTLTASRDDSQYVGQSYTSSKHYSLFQKNQSASINDVTCGDCGKVIYSYMNSYNGSASKTQSSATQDHLDITSSYNLQMGSHRMDAFVGFSYLYEENDGFYASNGNFPTEAYKWNSLGSGTYITEKDRHASLGSGMEDHTLVAMFGRVTYAFSDKYNLMATFRREGSSRFGENNRWGNFPSVSAGWTISNEDFMSSVDYINNLKLRVGYGVTGREPNENYQSQKTFDYDGWGDILGKNGSWVTTLYVTHNQNKDLKWEVSKEVNIGLDWSALGDRLTGTIDFYNKKTADLLYDYTVPVPPNLYNTTIANVGEMKNTGIEIMIGGTPVKTKDFTWNTNVTLSHNKNELVSLSNGIYKTDSFHETGGLGEPISTATHCMEEGKSLGDYWGLKSVGVDKNGYTLVEVKDADGNWTVKPFNTNLNVQANRQNLGHGTPQLYLGWTNNFTYKDFDLSMTFTGQFGYKVLNAQRCYYECNSNSYNRLKSAAKKYHAVQYDKTTGELQSLYDKEGNPYMVTLSKSQSQGFWSDHLEKGDFLKLNNVTLGYNVPLKGQIKEYLRSIRLYASCQNVFCITKYNGIDPEVENDPFAPGIDPQDKYPTVRTVTFGLNVKF